MTGVGTLLRSHLRRDRWIVLWWSLGITLLYYSQAVSIAGLYRTQAEFDAAAASMAHNAALVAMTGPPRALNTIGGQVTWQSAAFGAICVALMSMFLVGRHTRAEEESGRDELLRASVVDRPATTTAAAGTALVANLVVGLLVAVSLMTWPLAVADSLALGLGLTATGWVFTGVALVAMQLTSTTRAAYGLTGVVLAAAYLVRAVGDVGDSAVSWLSPIGLYQAQHAFSGVRWWPVVVLLVEAAVAGAAAYALFTRRDYGGGLYAARPGPARAARSLAARGAGRAGALGLTWRLQRGSVVGWAAGLFLMGAAYGSMGNDVGTLLGDNEAARDAFTGGAQDLVDGFYGVALVMLALLAGGFAISSALRPRGEEDDGRLEPLLATALPRRRWLLDQVAVTVAGTAVVVACGGLGLGAGLAAATDDPGAVARYLVGSLPYVAPVLVLSGLTRLLHGLHPRAASLGWVGLALASVVLVFGDLLRLPQAFQDASPFEHLALVPAEPFRWAPLLALVVVAAALSLAGRLAFARRDVR